MKQAIVLSLVLVFFSNSLTLFIYATGIDRQLVYVPGTILLLMAAVWWAHRFNCLSWSEIGLSGKQWKRSALFGTLAGLGLAALLITFLAFPVVLAQPVRYREIQNLDTVGLLWRVGVELTIVTAFAEEVLFRGILQAFFKRSLNTTRALILTNIVFALWHLVTNALSVQQNDLALPWIPTIAAQVIGYLGSLVAVGIGGFVLSILRERTNHLAGSISMHWITVAAMTLVIYFR